MSKESKRMNIIEVQTNLQKVTKTRISLAEIGRVLGITRQAISERAKNCRDLEAKELSIISQHYEIDLLSTSEALMEEKRNALDKLLSDTVEKVQIDYYPDVCGSCGNGVFQFSTRKEQITIPRNAFWGHLSKSKEYFVINAYGNSMEPFICDKDKLIIETWQGEQIVDNKAYLFAYKDELFIKRLAKNVDQLMVIPENKDYDIRKLEGEQLNDVNIIGQVVGLMRSMN